MTKVTMPEPVSRVVLRGDGPHLVYDHQIFSTDKRLITTDQAEAYTNQRVKQALEKAAAAVEQHDKEGREWVRGSLWDAVTREAASRIRALIPKEPPCDT